MNHRSRAPSEGRNPSPAEIKSWREAVGLTQAQAAELIHSTGRTWEKWEQGAQRMHPGLWAYAQSKKQAPTNQ